MLGDVVAVARHRVLGGLGPAESAYADLPVLPMGQARTRYYLSLEVADRPGVLAQVAEAFSLHGVSIQQVRQTVSDDDGSSAELVIVTHTATDEALAATVQQISGLDVVVGVISVMRVEGE